MVTRRVSLVQSRHASECIIAPIEMHSLARRACISATSKRVGEVPHRQIPRLTSALQKPAALLNWLQADLYNLDHARFHDRFAGQLKLGLACG